MFVLERLISLVAPHLCMVCGEEGAVVCDWCLPDFALPVPERCYSCQAATPDSRVCKKCRRSSKLKHVWVRAEYENRVKDLVYGFKFARKQAACRPIARMMAETLPYLHPDTVVVHVPTASTRARSRGYDHAELLAKAIAAEIGLKHRNLLSRITQTRQVGAKREERLMQMKYAFRVVDTSVAKGMQVLLVDDLTTTGATLEAAAKALREAGAKTVNAIVFAQK